MNYFCLSAAGPFFLSSTDARQAHPPHRLPSHSLRRVWIFDNKPSGNLSCGLTSSTRHVAAWDLNADGGSAGPGMGWGWGEDEAHSECRFIQPAGTSFACKIGLFSLFWEGCSATSLVSACQSVPLNNYSTHNHRCFCVATRALLRHTQTSTLGTCDRPRLEKLK